MMRVLRYKERYGRRITREIEMPTEIDMLMYDLFGYQDIFPLAYLN